jgi:PhnB protein
MARGTNIAKDPAAAAADLLRGVIRYLQSDGASDAVALYERAFGARQLSRTATSDSKWLMNCQREIDGNLVVVTDTMPEHGFPFQPSHSLILQLDVDDAQAWFDATTAAGCAVRTPVQKMVWGDKRAAVVDPLQILWTFDEPAQGAAS